MDKICNGCRFSRDWWCNRLVVPGGMGRHDRVGSDYLKNNECPYFEAGQPQVNNNKPNFENS